MKKADFMSAFFIRLTRPDLRRQLFALRKGYWRESEKQREQCDKLLVFRLSLVDHIEKAGQVTNNGLLKPDEDVKKPIRAYQREPA